MADDGLLSRYNPYYQSLSAEGRDRFLKRVLLFVQSKRFEYIDMEAQESIPLLIGAAAVQLTYGLDHFLLDYFSTIYVVRNKYTYGVKPQRHMKAMSARTESTCPGTTLRANMPTTAMARM